MSNKQAIDTFSTSNVDTIDLFDKIANFVEIEGAFNINSTSVDSWVAQLSSLRGKSVLYDNSVQNIISTVQIQKTHPF